MSTTHTLSDYEADVAEAERVYAQTKSSKASGDLFEAKAALERFKERATIDAKPSSEVIVMTGIKHPPQRAVKTADMLLQCYAKHMTPHAAMLAFREQSTREIFNLEDLFYALHAGLSAKRWELTKPRYKHQCKLCNIQFTNIVENCDYCCACEIRNQRDEWRGR